MAEAVAAFGVAANIVQFLEFGRHLFTTVWNLYRRGQDGAGALADLEQITKNLGAVLANLQLSSTDPSHLTQSERNFHELAKHCSELAAEMIGMLQQINFAAKGQKRDAIKTALKLIGKEDDIRSLQMRLEGFKHQLNLHLLASLREQATKTLDQQTLILNQLTAIHANTRGFKGLVSQMTADGLGTSLLSFLAEGGDQEVTRAWRSELVASMYNIGAAEAHAYTTGLSIAPDRKKRLQNMFISRLHYAGMDDRQGRIADAYEKTFEWLFADQNQDQSGRNWSDFATWLTSDSQLYWLTGKAGSGKSTLMKFICKGKILATDTTLADRGGNGKPDDELILASQHKLVEDGDGSKCWRCLQDWAAGRQLVIATYFFWNSGFQLQMSKEGLLRTLLYQILQQSPDLIVNISPVRWEALCLFNEDSQEWSKHELESMLLLSVQLLSNRAKVCLFVDGLDEFEGPHDDLLLLFKNVLSNPNVKICVSSRPWVLFEDAFKHRPSLRLEDLTYPDIKHYVASHFHGDTGFVQLCAREPVYAQELVEKVVLKASGVFLWVHLVVVSLLTGMGHGDRVSDLQRRLDALPEGLEDLYEKILHSLDPFYMEHAAQLFELVRQSLDPPSLLFFSFADEEDSNFVLRQPVRPLTDDERTLRLETTLRRLNSRCKGLLEVPRPLIDVADTGNGSVQYFHRTVKDFIESPKVWERLSAALKPAFDPHLRLCAGSLAYCKTFDTRENFLADGNVWACVKACFYHASRIRFENRPQMIPLLDELDTACATMAKRWSDQRTGIQLDGPVEAILATGQWVATHPLVSAVSPQDRFGCTFLSLAVRYNLTDYVKAKVNKGCLVQRVHNSIWPLLRDATYSDERWAAEWHDAVPSAEMIRLLLDCGADPTFSMPQNSSMSVWEMFLEQVFEHYDSVRHNVPPLWKDIVCLMFEHGANVPDPPVRALPETSPLLAVASLSLHEVELIPAPARSQAIRTNASNSLVLESMAVDPQSKQTQTTTGINWVKSWWPRHYVPKDPRIGNFAKYLVALQKTTKQTKNQSAR